MKRIAIFGKGGIGKSTFAAALAIQFHNAGDRVLHVGCDPKHDCSMRHGPRRSVPTVMDEMLRYRGRMGAKEFEETIISDTESGVHVLEAGGPEPGKGCAGRAVSMMLTLLDSSARIRDGFYDTVVLDVLGDVVCGGFAAPLQSPVPSDTIIVVSHEFMSIYAANNIAKGISNLTTAGESRLVGVVANRVDTPLGRAIVEAFAEKLSTRVLGVIPYCEEVLMADASGGALPSVSPSDEWLAACHGVYEALENVGDKDRVVPTPLAEQDLRSLYAKVRESFT
jgi:nitrogenase iron protein NifH